MTSDKITLDDNQMEAVSSNFANIVVIAAAGSGKTRTLTERVKRILEEGADPANLICITFTNLAAEEMLSRLDDVKGIEKAFIGTIHSLAFRLHGGSFALRTTDVEEGLIKDLLTPNIFDPASSVLTYERYEAYRKNARWAARTGRPATVKLNREELEVYNSIPGRLDQLCKLRNIISFDEVVEQAILNNTRPEVDHMLVDEFQDVGRNEYGFIMSLAAKNNFFVGDDWQSIYGFRGAEVGLFQSLITDPNFYTIQLTSNYRSGANIVDASCEVIENLDEYYHKPIYSMRKEPGRVVELNTTIVPFAHEYLMNSNHKDWFILARSNRQVESIISELKDMGIPAIGFKKQGLTSGELATLVETNAVKVLTIHIAKGLESKNVAFFDTPAPGGENDESIRIRYVAMTRAMDNLFIITNPRRNYWGDRQPWGGGR